MALNSTAFYHSLLEMKSSYLNDLQMIGNYQKASSDKFIFSKTEHIELLRSQLRLIIETIDEMVTAP